MEFFENIFKALIQVKNVVFCGKKRERSIEEIIEDENNLFSIKKRRLSQIRPPAKKIYTKENVFDLRNKTKFSLLELKENNKLRSTQAEVVFSNYLLTQSLLKLRNKIHEENLIQAESDEIFEKQNFVDEISPSKDEDMINTMKENNFTKFTFKKIQRIDLISNEATSSNLSKKSNKENQISPYGAIIESRANLLREFDNINNICENENENIQPYFNNRIGSENKNESDHKTNQYTNNFFSRILDDQEESKVSFPNNSKYLQEYNDMIESATEKSDSNNFPIISYDQFKILNEYLSGKIEIDLANYLNISRESMNKLMPNNWINDEVVNSYIYLLNKRQIEENTENKFRYAKVFIFNTFFYEKLRISQKNNEYSYEKMSKFWTKKSSDNINSLFDYDYLLVPINSNNNHWSLVLVNLHKKKFTCYESLENEERGFLVMNSLTKLFSDYITRVKDFRDEESETADGGRRKSVKDDDVNNKFSTSLNSSFYLNQNMQNINNHMNWNLDSNGYESESESDIDMMASFWRFKFAQTPQQKNGFDCGVFMCKFIDYLARNEKINFTQDHINYFRYLMAVEIIEGKLLTA